MPGEQIVPGDVPAQMSFGEAGSAWGRSVAWRDGVVLSVASVTGTLTIGDGTNRVGAVWGGYWGSHVVYAAADGDIFVDGQPTWAVPEARVWASGDAAVVAADGGRLYLLDAGVAVRASGIASLAVGADRVLALQCDPDCVGVAWDLAGEPLGEWAPGGEGGAVGEWEGVAWAGDPGIDDATATGRATSEAGDAILGLEGDHLGVAFGGGFVAGVFNKWLVPARERFVALDGGGVYAFDQGAEDSPVALAGDASRLVIGAPYYPHDTAPSGTVAIVER